jgi:hypothetical protein
MRPLTKEAEQKLVAAIERAAGYVNTGMAPNDAIVKSAATSDIPAGHINLMVHAYNTGRTTKQREQGDSTLEKAADFPMADAAAVIEALYPKAVKTSAEISQQHVVSAEYALPVRDMLARRQAGQVKAAAAKISLPEKTWVPPPRDPEAAVRRAASEKRAAELAGEELRRQATMAYSKAAAAMEALHEYFRHPGNMSFQDAVRETGLRLGAEEVAALTKLANVYPHLTKQAATKEVFVGECEPCKLAAAVVDAVEAYNAAQASVPVKQASIKKETPEILTESILYSYANEPLTLKTAAPGGGGRPGGGGGGGRGGRDHAQNGGGSTVNFGNILGPPRNIAGILGAADPAAAHKSQVNAFRGLTDPEHETALRNIRAQGMLHDMIMNDPVVSGHDPQEVAAAFNELADIAPQFVDSPAAMQALLRKRLESGQMADFDVKQLVDMEKSRADTNKARMETQKIERELI